MIARDAAGETVVLAGSGRTPAKRKTISSGDRISSETRRRATAGCSALVVLAADLFRIVDADVGRADQHLAEIRKQDADAPVLVLVIDHVAAERVMQLGIVDDQMRALGAAHHGAGARCGDGKVLVRSIQPPVALMISLPATAGPRRSSCR
jgi:hypothetical protein